MKEIEEVTNHDVKAVEYFIKEKMDARPVLQNVKEYVHFCCTSEDINNLAYSMMLTDARNKVLQKSLKSLLKKLSQMSETYADYGMVSRTHGQIASPTTMGKEIANFTYRINKQFNIMNKIKFSAKLNGAVGNFNAHLFAYPEFDWPALSQEFIEL